jgi:hypothetical protein
VAKATQYASAWFQHSSEVSKSGSVRLTNRAALFAFQIGFLLSLWILPIAAPASTAVFHLKNGDRISGRIISENTNAVVVETRWNKKLSIPSNEIERREFQTNSTPSPTAGSASAPVTPKAPVVAIPSGGTTKPEKKWKAEARIGADFLYGAKNQQIYYGRFKWSYMQPYHSHPKQYFQTLFDYSADYGWTEAPGQTTVVSANRMFASDKIGFDIDGSRWFTYGLSSGGYDEVRKIDFQFEAGAGIGRHLIANPTLTLNVESGLDYQEQYRSDHTTTKDPYFRAAEDVVWKITPGLTLIEKVEFFPRTDSVDFRFRAESTLSYALWRNVSLNFSVLDLYDTRPAQDVPNDDLQVHTSVGVSF